MCGRFTQNYTWQQVHEFLGVIGTPRNLQPHYNIAPTTIVDVVAMMRKDGANSFRCVGVSFPIGGKSR